MLGGGGGDPPSTPSHILPISLNTTLYPISYSLMEIIQYLTKRLHYVFHFRVKKRKKKSPSCGGGVSPLHAQITLLFKELFLLLK